MKLFKSGNLIFSSFLIILIIACIFVILFITFSPDKGERFTEFYILGPNGKAEDYPTEIKVDEKAFVKLGIINRELVTTEYHIEIYIDSLINNTMEPISLDNNVKWEDNMSFTPDKIGKDQKVEFLLYRNQQSEPYLELYILIDVVAK
jgi:uncharacterized membrane protein